MHRGANSSGARGQTPSARRAATAHRPSGPDRRQLRFARRGVCRCAGEARWEFGPGIDQPADTPALRSRIAGGPGRTGGAPSPPCGQPPRVPPRGRPLAPLEFAPECVPKYNLGTRGQTREREVNDPVNRFHYFTYWIIASVINMVPTLLTAAQRTKATRRISSRQPLRRVTLSCF